MTDDARELAIRLALERAANRQLRRQLANAKHALKRAEKRRPPTKRDVQIEAAKMFADYRMQIEEA